MKNQQRGNKFGLGHHKFMFEKVVYALVNGLFVTHVERERLS